MIGERTDTAQESGIQMFKWLQEHTDVEAYYVIDETSEDYAGIQHLDHVLRFGSEEHLHIAPQAQVLMCTHDIENIMPYKAAPGFWGYEDTTKIFLQHGVLGRKMWNIIVSIMNHHLIYLTSQATTRNEMS